MDTVINTAIALVTTAILTGTWAIARKRYKLLNQREVRLGLVGAEDRLAAWDAYAEALRAINDTEGWFRDPQWPEKPE